MSTNVWSIVIVACMTTFAHCFVLCNKVLSLNWSFIAEMCSTWTSKVHDSRRLSAQYLSAFAIELEKHSLKNLRASLAAEGAPVPTTEAKKLASSIARSKQEITEDFSSIGRTWPPRRSKKRPGATTTQCKNCWILSPLQIQCFMRFFPFSFNFPISQRRTERREDFISQVDLLLPSGCLWTVFWC